MEFVKKDYFLLILLLILFYNVFFVLEKNENVQRININNIINKKLEEIYGVDISLIKTLTDKGLKIINTQNGRTLQIGGDFEIAGDLNVANKKTRLNGDLTVNGITNVKNLLVAKNYKPYRTTYSLNEKTIESIDDIDAKGTIWPEQYLRYGGSCNNCKCNSDSGCCSDQSWHGYCS